GGGLKKSSTIPSSHKKSRQTLVGQRKTTLLLPDVNIFPSHLDASAGVNLQSNRAVGKSWGGIGKIRNSGSVKSSDDVIAVHRNFQIVPIARFQSLLGFWRGHRYPRDRKSTRLNSSHLV